VPHTTDPRESDDAMRTIARGLTAATILCFLGAGPALAGAARTHDGFFLRLSPGTGIANTRLGIADESRVIGLKSVDVTGTAADLDVAIGAMVRPGIALHLTLFGWSTHDPDADITTSRFGMVSGTLYGRETMSAIGPGFTWYLVPANSYLTGSAGVARLRFTGDIESETRTGFAMELALGREWWVGNSWGLGLAGGYTYHAMPDEDLSDDWSGGSYSLRLSATMN